MKLLKQIFYITMLIIGVCFILAIIAFVCAGAYYMWNALAAELVGTSLLDNLKILGIISLLVGLVYGVTYSPLLVPWAWKKLKELNNEK